MGASHAPNATLGASHAPNATLGASHAPNATLGASHAPNATLGASHAPNATLGASHAPNATLGRSPAAAPLKATTHPSRAKTAASALKQRGTHPSPNPDTKPPCGSGVLVKASFPP
ncbi:hypothetical protein CU254_31770 [Amycolatopsis sp. AA4]|nr:hypothetical protein CU254_31770 [Amycolatopsis sp. AA4]